MAHHQTNPRSFEALLAEFNSAALHTAGSTIYGLWPDLTLAYVNLEWVQFAARNGGEPGIVTDWKLGRCVLEAIAAPLRPFFSQNYQKCLLENRPWEHLYECSSPVLYRLFHMTTYPLGAAEGLLVVNSLRHEAPHTRLACPPLVELYFNEHGFIEQCCHCRRVRRVGADQVWDWVPEWVGACPPETSHGLCMPCLGYHYSSQNSKRSDFAKTFSTDSERGGLLPP